MADIEKQDSLPMLVEDVERSIDAILVAEGKAAIYETPGLPVCAPKPPFCSFCGKGENQVEQMLQGNSVFICDQCVMLCYEIVLMRKQNEDNKGSV